MTTKKQWRYFQSRSGVTVQLPPRDEPERDILASTLMDSGPPETVLLTPARITTGATPVVELHGGEALYDLGDGKFAAVAPPADCGCGCGGKDGGCGTQTDWSATVMSAKHAVLWMAARGVPVSVVAGTEGPLADAYDAVKA